MNKILFVCLFKPNYSWYGNNFTWNAQYVKILEYLKWKMIQRINGEIYAKIFFRHTLAEYTAFTLGTKNANVVLFAQVWRNSRLCNKGRKWAISSEVSWPHPNWNSFYSRVTHRIIFNKGMPGPFLRLWVGERIVHLELYTTKLKIKLIWNE